MTNFKLVNPYIQGEFNTNFKASSAEDAATDAWKNLSEYFVPHVRRFGFTMMGPKQKLHHFVVGEKMEDGVADFSITKVEPKLSADEKKHFLSKVKGLKSGKSQAGGARNEDKDLKEFLELVTDLDDQDDIMPLILDNKIDWLYQPIQYVWYDPYVYHVDWVSFPTFVQPLTPIVEIDLVSPYYYWHPFYLR